MTKHVPFLVAGAILVAAGVSLGAVGGAVVAAVGSDDTVSTGYDAISTPTRALVTEPEDFDTRGADILGRVTTTLSLRGTERPVFVGVGPADAVDSYLAGADIDTVTDVELDPLRLTTDRRGGDAQPAPPAAQPFWVAQSQGQTAAEIAWKLRDGTYRMVIMNADGSAGVSADARAGLGVAHLSAVGTGTLAAGLLTAIAGGVLFVLGLLGLRRKDAVAHRTGTSAPAWIPPQRQPEHQSAPEAVDTTIP